MIPQRLPRISAVYGTTGSAQIDPTDMMALRRPRELVLGLWNSVKNVRRYPG
jgi:hypothetical protein